MAYVPKQLPDDEQNQFGRTDPTTPFPEAPQGGGSAGQGGNAAPGVGTSTQFGSNAAKLTDYLKANEAQVGEFGQQVAGKLNEQYGQTMQGVDQGYNQFNQEIGTSYTPPDQGKVDQALKDPTGFAKDPNNVQQFQNWYSPEYKGPQNFEGSSVYQNLNDSVNKAVSNASLTQNQAGLGTFLNQFMGVNDSTEGMRALDTALLQRNPQSREAIQTAAKPFESLTGYLGNKTSKANQDIQNLQGQIAKSGEDVRKQTTGATDALTKQLDDRVAQSRTGAQSKDAAFRAAIEQGRNLTDDEIKSYGITNWADIQDLKKKLSAGTPFGDSEAKYDRKVDFNPYFTAQNADTAYSRANVANTDEYAQEAALQQLTGNRFNILGDDPSQAGSAPGTLSQFNSQQAGQDLKNQLTGLDDQFLNQYKDFNLGAYDTGGWMNLLKDPFQQKAYQGMIDIYGRNADKTNTLQKGVADQLSQWIQQANPNPNQGGGGGGDAFKPGDPEYVSPNLRIVKGQDGQSQQMWYDGNNWVQAPPEFRNMQNGGYTEQFNYDTGKYEPTGWTGGTPDDLGNKPIGPGVVSGGGTNYIDPTTGKKMTAF